jgi:hypothetical protein
MTKNEVLDESINSGSSFSVSSSIFLLFNFKDSLTKISLKSVFSSRELLVFEIVYCLLFEKVLRFHLVEIIY